MSDADVRCGQGFRAGVVRIEEVSDKRKCSKMFKDFIVTLCYLLLSYEVPAISLFPKTVYKKFQLFKQIPILFGNLSFWAI